MAQVKRTMRAKMQVTEIVQTSYQDATKGLIRQDRVKMAAVAAKSYPPDGSDEDNSFARFSPAGELTLTIANPALIDVIKPGQKFYMDFTLAD